MSINEVDQCRIGTYMETSSYMMMFSDIELGNVDHICVFGECLIDVGINGVREGVPCRCELLTMGTPWGIELDEPFTSGLSGGSFC